MAKPRPLSLGVAMIAKDAEGTLPACLASIRPYASQIVVAVDTSTTDSTAKVARHYGAEVHRVTVSHPHECDRHGAVMAQHFGEARNHSFSFLRKDLDYWLWLDADDVLEGGEHLAKLLASTPTDAVGIWLPYQYSTMEKDGCKAVNTLFERERILRSSVGWRWQYRVHEVIVPQGVDRPHWVRSDALRVVHQQGMHHGVGSAERNILLLEIDLEENPQDSRAIWYMGNQYFAQGKWTQAAEWFERHTRTQEANPYQLWQSYCYMSMAYGQMGDLDAATYAAFGAIDCQPEHAEPYIQLASIYLQAGDAEKSEYWARQAEDRPETPFFVFKNPMDVPFNRRVTLANALSQQGRISESRSEFEAAYRTFPDDRVKQAIQRQSSLEESIAQAEGFKVLSAGMQAEDVLEMYRRMPGSVRAFGRVRDIAVPAMLKGRLGSQPRIVFWCGKSAEEWAPPSTNGGGIGGSETAVIEIARRFAADGWRVDVFNSPGRFEGLYDGVGYWEPSRLERGAKADVLVSWRNPHAHTLPIERRAGALLWLHDYNYGPDVSGDMGHWDRVLGVSAWHAGMLARFYPEAKVGYVPNGIDPNRFDPTIKRVPWRCVYASSPDRGLLQLLQLWPLIVENEPGAELHVAYGWDTFDRMAESRLSMAAYKKAVMKRLEHTPQVVYRGRLPQDELAKLYSESYAWLYPTNFLEVSCISAMEAMSGGAVPIVTQCGALPETIGGAGLLVDLPGSAFPAQPHSGPWQQFYTQVARGLLSDTTRRLSLSAAGRERAKDLTWDASYRDHWVPMVAALMEREPTCV